MPVRDDFTVDDVCSFFASWLDLFKSKLEIVTDIRVDESIAYDVLYNYVQDRKRIQLLNKIPQLEATKCQACMAFWIRKLKPLYYASESDPNIGVYLNELFGLTIAFISCQYEKAYPIELDDRFLADLLFQFRYKSVSPHSLNMVLLAIFNDSRAKNNDCFV